MKSFADQLLYPKGRRHKPAPEVITNFKEVVIRNPRHLHFLSTLPCLECGVEGYTQAAHLSFLKYGGGRSHKVGDDKTLPFCCAREGITGCHAQHDAAKFQWWVDRKVDDPGSIAAQLYRLTGNDGEARVVVLVWNRTFRERMFGNGR